MSLTMLAEMPVDELISRIAAETGIDPAVVAKAVPAVLGFLARSVPPETLAPLRDAFPEAAAQWDASGGEPQTQGGLLGGLFGGGGITALAGELGEAGLSMSQMQDFAKAFFAVGREKAGEDAMGSIVASVPMLAQFV